MAVEPTSRLTITIPTRLRDEIKEITQNEGRTMVWYITQALEEFNEKVKREGLPK